MFLSCDVETDANLSETSELSMSSGYEILSYSNKSMLRKSRVSSQERRKVYQRYEVSDRAGAAIASPCIQSFWNWY